MNSINKTSNKLLDIYKLNKVKSKLSEFAIKPSSYFLNVIIVIILYGICLIYYLKIDFKTDIKDWQLNKCQPKYLFFSGYIKPEKNYNSYDTTINNITECTTIMGGDLLNTMNINNSDMHNTYKSNLNNLKNKLKDNDNLNQTNYNKIISDISNNIDISLNIDGNTTSIYSNIYNTGIYVDQLDSILNYIKQYIRNYLTYLHMLHISKYNEDSTTYSGSLVKAEKINTILTKYFGGLNI